MITPTAATREPPRLRFAYPMGAMRPLFADPLGFALRAVQTHGDVVGFRVGPMNAVLLRHPDAIEHVLVDAVSNYDEEARSFDRLRPWRRQPPTAAQAFATGSITEHGATMVAVTRDMLDRWEAHALLSRTVDMMREMSTLTRRIADETLLDPGHETIATALAWTFLALSRHPTVERSVRTELDVVLQGRLASADDLPRLPLLEQVVAESLRIDPPVWMIDRRAVADDAIMGYRIPAGSIVLLSPFVTHRDPDLWPNPEGFDPERFAPARDRDRPRWAYFPFGAAPRQSTGIDFALMELRLVLATVLQRFRPWLVPGHVVAREPLVTLRPRHGLEMGLDLAPAPVRSVRAVDPQPHPWLH